MMPIVTTGHQIYQPFDIIRFNQYSFPEMAAFNILNTTTKSNNYIYKFSSNMVHVNFKYSML